MSPLSQHTSVRNAISYDIDSLNLKQLKTELFDYNHNLFLHPEGFVVNSSISEYIPITFLHGEMFELDNITGEITEEINIPISYRPVSSTRSLLQTMASPRRNNNNNFLFGKNNIYASNGIMMKNDTIIFCCAIKTKYIKDKFCESAKYLYKKPFWKTMIDNQLMDHNRVKSLKYRRISEYLESLSTSETAENVVVMINPDLLKSALYRYSFELDNDWYEFAVIEENDKDYFNSLLFGTTPALSFDEIDGPEKLSKSYLGIQ